MMDRLVFLIDLIFNFLFLAIITAPAFSPDYLTIMTKMFVYYILLIIVRVVLIKVFKANGDIVFQQKNFNLAVRPIYLLTVLTIYLLYRESLSIFYLLTFGGTLLIQVLDEIK